MKHIQINDHNYQTIESLADSTGDLNTAVVKSEHFQSLAVYKKLLECTKELDIFDGINVKHRFSYYMGKAKIEHCVKCGKPFIYFKNAQRRFALCRHKQIDPDRFAKAVKAGRDMKKRNFMEALKDCKMKLTDSEYKQKLSELTAKPVCYAFIVTKDEYSSFYHDLIIRTKKTVPIDGSDLQIPKRLYLEQHGLDREPLCSFCRKNKVVFINRLRGYNDSCNECSTIKANTTRETSNRENIDKVFNFSKYDIVEYPKLLNKDPLVIKCHKCGTLSEVFVHNGFINSMSDAPLCEGCEHKSDWEETEFFNFISSVYDGEIIHGKGGRKTIPPYELDFYLPDKKLAFEYDGVYWHNDQIKTERRYHLMKTEMCEKLGIRLVHVFSSDWNMHRDVTKSRVRNLLGIYDKVVYARKCEVKAVNSNDSLKFQDENHIQGRANASVNLGLYYKDELIALMTFCKCRFDKKHEWEMLRFCTKLGYHIPGAAGKLLRKFENSYAPKSMISYADRRWSQGKLYFALGFTLKGTSSPNYWYFKNRSDELLSRVNFQKHKLKNKLETFDPNKTEIENMRANGYSRIFDCGNLVFEKTYSR